MKAILKTISAVIILAATGSCAAHREIANLDGTVSPLSGRNNISEGSLVYALPLTVIDVRIDVERVVSKPGPYARYAEDLLGLKDVILKNAEKWTVRGIVVSAHEELDPAEFYVVETNSIFQTNVFSLKREGLILDLNPEIYGPDHGVSQLENRDANLRSPYDLGSDEYFNTKKDTLYKLVNMDTTFIRIPYLVEKKQTFSVDQLAEKAASRLMELRDGKQVILTGEANVFPQSDAAIKEINRMEKEYTELFVGKTWKESRSFTYHVIPQKENAGKPVKICGFSPSAGPSDFTGKEESVISVEFVPEMKTKELLPISRNIPGSSKSKNDRIYYRVPDVANVTVKFGDLVVSSSRQLIFQLGEVIQLPSNYILGK